jgi:hypothetical protein
MGGGGGERSSRQMTMCATAALIINASNWGGWGGCLGFFVHLCSLTAEEETPDVKFTTQALVKKRCQIASVPMQTFIFVPKSLHTQIYALQWVQ